jgi:hypothetical protein
MRAIHTTGLEEAYWSEEPGAVLPPRGSFEVKTVTSNGQRVFKFICPGCASLALLAIRPVIDGSPQSWEWNGSIEAPTLTPSINHPGCWHGWLTDGVFTAC